MFGPETSALLGSQQGVKLFLIMTSENSCWYSCKARRGSIDALLLKWYQMQPFSVMLPVMETI